MVPKKITLVFASKPLTSLLTLLLIGNVLGAGNESAFDTLEIGFNYVVNTNRNIFHDYWIPGQGISVFIETPFYYGIVQAGVQAFPFYGRMTDVPDFQIASLYLKWGQRWELGKKLDWYGHIGVGYNIMIFREGQGYARHESELGMCLDTGVSYLVHRDLAVYLAGSYDLIFTHKQIRLVFMSAGMSYSLSTPAWLKVFLE